MMSPRRLAAHCSFLVIPVPVALLLLSALNAEAAANYAPPPACSEMLKDLKAGKIAIDDLRYLSNSPVCFWELALQSQPQTLRSTLRAEAAAQKSAATVQIGAPSGSNGTTSAVTKPNTPLSLASEYGGITSSTSNQTMTLQTTLDGIPTALAGRGVVPYCISPIVTIPGCVSWKDLQRLNRFGVGVTSNTTAASQNISGTAAPAQGSSQQASLATAGSKGPSLSSVFAKATIWRGQYKLPAKGPEGSQIESASFDLAYGLKDIPLAPTPANPPTLMSYTTWENYQAWQKCMKDEFLQRFEAAKTDTARNDLFVKYYGQIVGILFRGKGVTCPADNVALSDKDLIAPFPPSDEQAKLIKSFETYMAATSMFEAQLAQMVLAAAAPVLSFEYDYNTPVNQPTTSTAKLVFSKAGLQKRCASSSKKTEDSGKKPDDKNTVDAAAKPMATADSKDKKPNPCANSTDGSCINQLTGTLNAGGNFYNSAPSSVPGAGAFRDAQVGAELDYAVCTSSANPIWSFMANATFGLAYYYQDQVSPSILKVTPGMSVSGINIVGLASTTSSVFSKKGPINFAQFKYGLGTGKNVKFPIAFSYSNRTDLITKPLWSAQFGVSYDFSSLLNSSSSSNTSAADSKSP